MSYHTCGYEWDSRVDKPKSCPRCKRRLDIPYKSAADQPQVTNPAEIKSAREVTKINIL